MVGKVNVLLLLAKRDRKISELRICMNAVFLFVYAMCNEQNISGDVM
jgi:hypothetical protein